MIQQEACGYNRANVFLRPRPLPAVLSPFDGQRTSSSPSPMYVTQSREPGHSWHAANSFIAYFNTIMNDGGPKYFLFLNILTCFLRYSTTTPKHIYNSNSWACKIHCLNLSSRFIPVKQVYTALKNKHNYVRNLIDEQDFLFRVSNL